MPREEILILAMTRMRSGICTAGLINRPHPASRLQWVRPVKEFGSLLLGDMSDADGRVVEINDVISLNLLQPRPDPVHAEDWLTDFVHQRPRLLRQLTDQKRADFLAQHQDASPTDVLVHQTRSLCLIRPDQLWARFTRDDYSGKYQARLGFRLDGLEHAAASASRGLPVTDLKWRALGRRWLDDDGISTLVLDHAGLHGRLAADVIYLTVGLSRPYRGRLWPLIVGVHPAPDYTTTIDYDQL